MAWQYETGAGSARAANYHDLINKIVLFSTSQHVATVAVAAGGSGYGVGDVLTLPHASAHNEARVEVTAIGVGGVITGLRITSNGAYAQQAVSASVTAAGSGYVVGDVLSVSGGSARCPAKFKVASLSGSGVATVTLFEGGGVYATATSGAAATVGVGPTAFAGDNAATLTVTYQAVIGLTGQSVTGGTGSSGTVTITLAETGWAVSGRDTNNLTFNGVTNEKEVVMVGDAPGFTNKPYFGLASGTATSGINSRYFVNPVGLIAHNPALSLASQVNGNGNPGTFSDNYVYLLCDENQSQEMNLFLSVDDLACAGVLDTNSAATATGDREYHNFYVGFMDTFATEAENPYPYFIGGSTWKTNLDPSTANGSITAFCEASGSYLSNNYALNNSGQQFYCAETSEWVSLLNVRDTLLAGHTSMQGIAPLAHMYVINSGSWATGVGNLEGPIDFVQGVANQRRGSPTRLQLPVPGTTDGFFPIPLTVGFRPGASSVNETLDTIRGQLRNFFWVSNCTDAGVVTENFAEDYITIGTDRYRVFHNHVHTQSYQFFCIKESV